MRIGLGLGLSSVGAAAAAAWAPPASGLIGYYHADDMETARFTPGAQANFVPKLGDNSGNGRTLATGGNTNSPRYNATIVGGLGGIQPAVASSGYMLRSASPSDWAPLHDGTGCTVVVLSKPTTAQAASTALSTNNTNFVQGLSINHDGNNGKWLARVRNATVEILLLQGANASTPINTVSTTVFTYQEGLSPEGVLRVNGTQVASGNTTAAPTATAPAGLCLGRLYGAGLQWFDGGIRAVLIYNRVLSSAEILDIEANIGSLATPRPLRSIWTVGDSITAFQYQQQIWSRMLATRVARIDFLGSLLAGEIALLTDRQHDGWSAHTISQIQTQITGLSLDAAATDVFVTAGTNDITNGTDVAAARDRFATLVGVIRSQQPAAKIWVGRPPRRTLTGVSETEAYAALLATYAGTLPNAAYVDTDVANAGEISGDGVHPTATGYVTIGNKWADAIGL